MRRHSFRRSLKLESLERREVMSAGGPSAEAQYMLELINQARTNPQATADRVTSKLTPDEVATVNYYGVNPQTVHDQIASVSARPPVAWNDTLAATATQQSQDQVSMGVQTHMGADGSNLSTRLDRAGYTNRVNAGENAYAYSQSVDHAMEAFLIDWGVGDLGHRRNILQPDVSPDQYYREVGIGIVNTNGSNLGPEVITQDFGNRVGTKPYLLGVAYNDLNHDGQYSLGEGQGNVEIDATNVSTGQTSSVLTWDSGGGYQMQLDPGTYDITARVGNNVIRNDVVSIGNQNVEIDYNLSNPGPSATLLPVANSTSSQSQSQNSTPVTTVAPTSNASNAWNTVSNAPVVQQAQVQAQVLTPVARAGVARLANWASWTARRLG